MSGPTNPPSAPGFSLLRLFGIGAPAPQAAQPPRMPPALAEAARVAAVAAPALRPAHPPAPVQAPAALPIASPLALEVIARHMPAAVPVPTAPHISQVLADQEQTRIADIDRLLYLVRSFREIPANRSSNLMSLLGAFISYENQTVRTASLFTALRYILGKALKREIPNDNALMDILRHNPDLLFTIKNNYGIHLLDQLVSFLYQKRSQHAHLQQLHAFESALVEGDKRLSGCHVPDLRSILDANAHMYRSLPSSSKEFFGSKIWEQDRRPNEWGYGDRVIAQDVRTLRRRIYEGKTLLHYRIDAVRAEITGTPFAPSVMETGPFDTSESMQSTYFINQLQRMLACLDNGSSSYEDKMNAFEGLDPSLKGILCEVVWLCDGGPMGDSEYGSNAIKKNPHILLRIQNLAHKNIVQQLIEHYTMLKEAQKAHPQLQQLIDALAVGPERFKEVFVAMNEAGSPVTDELSYRVWVRDGSRLDAGLGYGQRIILESTDLSSLLEHPKINFSKLSAEIQRRVSLNIRERMKSDFGIQRLVETLPATVTEIAYKVAMISAELKGIASEGGLGEAVLGMARSSGHENTVVILPKYDADTLPQGTSVTPTEYSVTVPLLNEEGQEIRNLTGNVVQRTHRVFKAIVDGGLPCYLIENDELFYIGKGNKIYNGASDAHVKARFAHFQRLAAELALQLYTRREIQVVHLQDSQSALVSEYYAQRHHEAWKTGATPPVVFTLHNNLPGSQANYNYREATASLGAIGLRRQNMNSLVRGVATADAITTVSPQFAEEAQSIAFGEGLDAYVKQANYQGKLTGILNGNTLGWNPKTDKTLKSWIQVGSDIPTYNASTRTTARPEGKRIDLSFGPEDSPEVIARQKQLCKQELAKYVEQHGLGTLDPRKPLLLYFGRLDPTQKGIDKLPFIMQEALNQGAQMVVIGPKADRRPSGDFADERTGQCMRDLYTVSDRAGSNGAIVIEDQKINGKFQWQNGHTRADGTEVQGFGSLLRAAADLGVFPSLTEPCGLVQGETWLMGGRVLATDVGGLHDTIVTAEDKDAGKPGTVNGFKFTRDMHWMSPAQYTNIARSLREAISFIKAKDTSPEALLTYHAETKRIMGEARQSTWTRTPSKLLLAIEMLQHIHAHATPADRDDFYDHIDGVVRGIPYATRPAEWDSIHDPLQLNMEKLQYIYTYASNRIINNFIEPVMKVEISKIEAAHPGSSPTWSISMASWLSAAEQLKYTYELAIRRAQQRSNTHFDLRGLPITSLTDEASSLRHIATTA